jgi:integrase
MARLSDARIRSLKPSSRDRWVGDGNALWLRVRTSGAKVFVIRVKRGGRAKVLTLGAWPGVTLAAARDKAHEIAGDRAGHLVRPPTGPQTVAALAQEFYERRIQGRYRRTKNALTYRKRLEQELGWRKLREVRPQDIAACVKAYAAEAPVAANRYLSFTKRVFGYAVETGALDLSPAAMLTQAAAGGAESPRDRVLTDAELRAVWHTEGEHGRLLRFLLLTGARIGEAQRATWAHIDLPARRWTIPAAHAKNKRAHWVHLPDAVLAILHLPGAAHQPILRSASETAVQAWLRRWCERERIHPRFTPHDLRRTFVTRLGDLGIAPHVIRALVNHVESGAIAVYLRAQFEAERIEATERWAAELQRVVQPAARQ